MRTGALICGAAGLLKGRRAATHWSAFHLLSSFGAIPVNEGVVIDGAWIFAAGVTAGIDGALRLVAELRGDGVAQTIQLHMAYAPEPPFDSGTPETAHRPSRSNRNRLRAVPPPNLTAPGRQVWREPRVYWRTRQPSHH